MSATKFTPGPWRWNANPKSREAHIEGGDGIVLDFVRWGMSGAAPRFRSEDRNTMQRVEAFFGVAPGREHHASWHALIEHPDAHLIAAAPELYEALETVADALSRACDIANLGNDDRWAIKALSDATDALERARREDR